jgi:hypothetical protein
MSTNAPITILCRLPLDSDVLAGLDRMAAKAGKSRDELLADFAQWLVRAETPERRRA